MKKEVLKPCLGPDGCTNLVNTKTGSRMCDPCKKKVSERAHLYNTMGSGNYMIREVRTAL